MDEVQEFDIELKPFFVCPLCNESVRVKQSKKGLPYIICNDCGVQMFVRYEKGIRRLAFKTFNMEDLDVKSED